MSEQTLPHIRKAGRNGRSKETECGAPATKADVNASAWLKPFSKCPDCGETIRLRMLRVMDAMDAKKKIA